MDAGTGKMQLAADDTVDQHPIRFDVRVPETSPVALQRMVEIPPRQGFFPDQQAQFPKSLNSASGGARTMILPDFLIGATPRWSAWPRSRATPGATGRTSRVRR